MALQDKDALKILLGWNEFLWGFIKRLWVRKFKNRNDFEKSYIKSPLHWGLKLTKFGNMESISKHVGSSTNWRVSFSCKLLWYESFQFYCAGFCWFLLTMLVSACSRSFVLSDCLSAVFIAYMWCSKKTKLNLTCFQDFWRFWFVYFLSLRNYL